MERHLAWMVLPDGWNFDKAKYIFKQMNRPIRPDDEIITAFRDGTVTLRSNRRTEGFTNSLKEIGYQGVRKGDLVIHAMDGFAGAVGVSDSDGKSTPVYSVCQPIVPANNYYYGYLIRFLALNGFIESLARGIRERSTEFRFKEFRELELPIPPLDVQNDIVQFLDTKVFLINTLIAKYQRLIELLEEKRTSLISQAVTKGLDASVKMKDSGVEWLGKIPLNWKVSLLKRYFQVDLGKMLDSSNHSGNGILKPYLRAANIQWGYFLLDDVNEMFFTNNQLDRLTLKNGDLLVTEGGVTVGRSAIWRDEMLECYYQNSLNRVRPIAHVSTEFLFYWIYFLKENGYIDLVAEKATFGHLTKEKLEELPLVVPPEYEMKRIVDVLDIYRKSSEEVKTKILCMINRLKEYRTALISAVVTGKIDVRN